MRWRRSNLQKTSTLDPPKDLAHYVVSTYAFSPISVAISDEQPAALLVVWRCEAGRFAHCGVAFDAFGGKIGHEGLVIFFRLRPALMVFGPT